MRIFREDADREGKIPYRIHEMVRKGLIQQDGDGLVMDASYREIIGGMKHAKAVMTVNYMECNAISVSVYLGDKCVILQDSPNDKAAIRIRIADKDEIPELLKKNCFREGKRYPQDLEDAWAQETDGRKTTVISIEAPLVSDKDDFSVQWILYDGRYGVYAEKLHSDEKIMIKSGKDVFDDITEVLQSVLEVK